MAKHVKRFGVSGPWTDMQVKYVQKFAENGGKGAEAARFAGYSKGGCRSRSTELLKKPHIRKAIAKLQADAQRESELTQQDVVRELASIAMVRVDDVFDFEAGAITVKSLDQIPVEARAAISKVRATGTGKDQVLEIEFHSKTQALRDLGRYFGLFTDRVLTISPADFDNLTDSQVARLAANVDPMAVLASPDPDEGDEAA